MHEERPPMPDSFIESELAGFLLDHVRAYEDLNAPTLEEADMRFSAELANIVKETRVGKIIGSGYFFRVYELADDPRVAIKRLRTSEDDNTILTQEWGRIQNAHQTVLGYFGKKFTPDTDFLTFDNGLKIGSDRQDAQPSRLEHVMIQERALGRKFLSFQASDRDRASLELKAAAAEYVVRYERMLRDGRVMDHPDDLMINDGPNANRRITILDTNMVGSFEEMVNSRNSRIFLEEFGIDPTTVKKPEDIMRILQNVVPLILGLQTQQAEEFRTLDYPALMNELRPENGRLYGQLWTAPTLRRVPSKLERVPEELRGNPFLDYVLPSGLETLISTADRFAVEGHHPQEVAHIMEAFGITDTDLRQFDIT